jgi:hypothetical protein
MLRWYYADAQLEWVVPVSDATDCTLAMRMTTTDPYETVVGHYLGLAGRGSTHRDLMTPAGHEFSLVGGGIHVDIESGARTRITITRRDPQALGPPPPVTMPQLDSVAKRPD